MSAAAHLLPRARVGRSSQRGLNTTELVCVLNWIGDAQHVCFAIDVVDPIARVGVIAHPLRATLPLLFQSLKHIRQVVRVVASVCHYLRAENVSLFLIFAAELEEVGTDAHLTCLGYRAAGAAANYRTEDLARYRASLVLLSLGLLGCSVPQCDVTDLVRDHASHLAFIFRRFDQPAIDVGETTRQRERVYFGDVYNLVRVLELRMLKLLRYGLCKPPADARDVVLDLSATEQRQLLFGLLRSLSAKLDILRLVVWVFRSYDASLRQYCDGER